MEKLIDRKSDNKITMTLENAYRSNDASLDEVTAFKDTTYLSVGTYAKFKEENKDKKSNTVNLTYIEDDSINTLKYDYNDNKIAMEKVDAVIDRLNKTSYTGLKRIKAACAVIKSMAKYDGKGQNAKDWANGSCKCTGYVHAFALYCYKEGISFILINGWLNDEKHAWAEVKINEDGKIYYIHVDPTNNRTFTDEEMVKYKYKVSKDKVEEEEVYSLKRVKEPVNQTN